MADAAAHTMPDMPRTPSLSPWRLVRPEKLITFGILEGPNTQ